jgi:hypothetical protein
MKKRDPSIPCAIDDHKLGSADRLSSSRKTRSARVRYQGFANRCRPRWSATAISLSAARLYEMNALKAFPRESVVLAFPTTGRALCRDCARAAWHRNAAPRPSRLHAPPLPSQ